MGFPLEWKEDIFSVLSDDRPIIEADIDADIAADGSADLSLNALQPAQQAGMAEPLRVAARVKTSPSGIEEIALDANVQSFELLDWAVEGLTLTADYVAARQDGAGSADIAVGKLQFSRAWLEAYKPLFKPFSQMLNEMVENPESWARRMRDVSLRGKLALGRDGDRLTANFVEPMRITSAATGEPAGADIDLSISNISSFKDQPALAVSLTPAWAVDAHLELRQTGIGLSNAVAKVHAKLGADPETGGTLLDVTQAILDVEPIILGDVNLAGSALTVSGAGPLNNFQATLTGDLTANGTMGQSFSFKDTQINLDGGLQVVDGRATYMHTSGACTQIKSVELGVIKFFLPNSDLRACPKENTSLAVLELWGEAPSKFTLSGVLSGRDDKTRITDKATFNLNGDMPQIDLTTAYNISTDDWSLDFHLSEGAMIFGDDVAELSDIDFQGEALGDTDGIQNVAGALNNLKVDAAGKSDLFAPFFLDGSMTTTDRVGAFSGTFKDPKGRSLGGFEGSQDWQTQFGILRFDTGSLTVSPTYYQPQELFPPLVAMMADATGSLRAQGVIDWRTGTITSNGVITLTDLNFASAVGPVEGVNAQIELGSLLPIATKKPQRIDIQLIDIGMELLFGEFLFSLTPKGDFVLEGASWPWSGGEIGIDKSVLLLNDESQNLTVYAKDIDLADVFTLLDVDGLSGSGVLAGQLPVSIEGGGALITDGRLATEGGGVLRYVGSLSQAGDANEGSSLMFNALKNFTYESLEVEINGRTTDILNIGIHLNGSNPEVLDGYPIKLNISTEGPLAEMIRQGTIGYRLPGKIRDRIQ